MSVKLLLEQFDRLVEARDAVPLLRRFVIDLALRGRLVEQEPSDEPAIALLGRMQLERSSAIKKGRIHSAVENVGNQLVVPFSLPNSWTWTILGSVAQYGVPEKIDSNQLIDEETWVLDLEDIEKDTSRLLDRVHSSARPFQSTKTVFKKGDVLFGKLRPYLNKVLVADRDGVCTTEIIPIRGRCGLLPGYTKLVLKSSLTMSRVAQLMYGMKMPRLGTSDAIRLPFPLPPFAEQQRIVSKVDELMILCDELEAAQQERERCRDRLAAASLLRINRPSKTDSPETRRKHTRFYLQHLTRLTARPELIKALRQTIRNLAVQGLITPQDSSPESTLGLLDVVRKKKAHLLKAGLIPKEKTSRDIAVLGFAPPIGWQAVRLEAVCNLVTSGSRGWAGFYAETGAKFLRAQNIRFGRLLLDQVACVNPPAKSEGARTQVQRGDLLIVITGAGVTNPALLDEDLGEAYVSQHVALVRPTDLAMSQWLLLCLMAEPGGRAELLQRAYGAGKPGLNLDNIRSLTVPIPPLAEQDLIISKVNELVAICDELEVELSTTQVDNSRLLANLLDQTLGVTRVSMKAKPHRPLSPPPVTDHQKEEASRYMTSNPAATVDQLIGCIDDLGGSATPERLLKHSGLSEDLETFYDLLRAARDSGALVARLGSGESIQRPSNAY